MNHRYEDRSHEREERERDRPYRADRSREGRQDFYPGGYGFDEQRGQYSEEYGGRGSGGASYGASGYGSYGGEGEYGRSSRDFSRGDYGRESQGELGRSQFGRERGRYGEGREQGREEQRGGSYGGYGTTGDYGYGSPRRSELGRGAFGRDQESQPYYGTGEYRSGGSGFGGGYGGIPGIGAFGPSGGSYNTQYGIGDYRESNQYGRGWGEERSSRGSGERPGLLGRLFGRGPKGYRRSDERLKEDISERLMQSDTIDSSEVTVEVAEGLVTLQGTVPERYMKHAIEDLVDVCPGVKDIDNRIRVQREDMGTLGRGVSSTSMAGSTTTGNGNGGSTAASGGGRSRKE